MSETVHIAGIGGVGMSALAQALLDSGVSVTGSDRLLDKGDRTETLVCLERQGIRLFPQDGSGLNAGVSRLVVSSAIEPDNPDLLAAGRFGVPSVHRAAELARVVGGHRLCAVTGTCGKSTVTAMLGHLLAETGFDPLVVNGAAVAGWDADGTRIGSVRPGKGEWAVIEADESDKSLMVFQPDAVIVTNASSDHFAREEADCLFDTFSERAQGRLVDGRLDTADDLFPGGFLLDGVRFTVPMPGLHNAANARLAARMARLLGAPLDALPPALLRFKGVVRRLQQIGFCNGAKVVDDYAHNPEKLAAAWTTLQQEAPDGVVGVWRPHGYGPLRKMMDGLAAMFTRVLRPCDTLLLLPVYDAGGTADRSVESGTLAEQISGKTSGTVLCVPDIASAETEMRSRAKQGRALVTLGARDPDLPRLAARLAKGK
ncbi:MAG: hypothetical protein J5985_09715 [Kiritimatiellae bacterium]|nr:hypothetical protein [Kiritimatiellia bacterium]